MKILIITDAWHPQVNGVVNTFDHMIEYLEEQKHQVEIIHPGLFFTIPLLGYTEIKLALNVWKVPKLIRAAEADCIHIVTEGPLGHAAVRYLNKNGLSYTSSFHTKFPEFVKARLPFTSVKFGYKMLRWFHSKAKHVLVPTPSLGEHLEKYNFKNLVLWGRGVDTELFNPDYELELNYDHPVFMYVGRVSAEKNIQAFLDLPLEGTKVVVGDGPQRLMLEKKYPTVKFVGYKKGPELAAYYAAANVFVFPSKTDTFGNVVLEALACGTPVAAYPVTGPKDIIQQGVTGYLSNDLHQAVLQCMTLNRADCRAYACDNGWTKSAQLFLDNLVPLHDSANLHGNNTQQYVSNSFHV